MVPKPRIQIGLEMGCWRKKNKESCVIGDLVSQLLLGRDRDGSQDGQRSERPTQSLLVGAVNRGLRGQSHRPRRDGPDQQRAKPHVTEKVVLLPRAPKAL